MATIPLPIPLIHCGLLPEPHLAPGMETSALGAMSADELREFFRHALSTLHPCFVLLTWAGYEVVDLEVAQRAGGAATGTPARVEIATMEIHEGRWTTPAGAPDGTFPDGTYFVLLLRARPGLPAQPLPLTILGSPVSGELSFLLEVDPSSPWNERFFELLRQLAFFGRTVAEEIRSTIRTARGSLTPAAWIRDPLVGGFLRMYDYSSWRFDALDAALPDASAPIRSIGEHVWTSVTGSGALFDRFLEEEPARVDGLEGLIFPGRPLVSAFQRVSAFDASGGGAAADALSHHVDAANLVRPGLLASSDLKLFSYTELLSVLSEVNVVDVAAATPLSGEALRDEILLRLAELAPLAHQVLEALEDWQETNYSDLAHTLEGEMPSYATADWWLGFYANLLAETMGTAAPFAANGLVTWIAGAAAALTVSELTVIGFVIGLGASVVLGDLLAPSEAEQAERISDAHERSLFFEQLWHEKVRTATADASARLDQRIAELRLRVDPFTDEAMLQDLYSKVLADLEACAAQPVPPTEDRKLADSQLYVWLLDEAWGFTPYSDQGSFAPTTALVTKVRDRVLVWPPANNPTLFLSQCEYEWRSLGFPCDSELEALRNEATTSAADNAQRFQGRAFTFGGVEIDATFREKWATRYGSTLTWGVLDPHPPDFGAGSTRVTERGLREIRFGRFSARCTLRLAVTAGCCRVTTFEYRLEGDGDFFAEIFVSTGSTGPFESLEPVPNTYHDYRVVPDRPLF